TAHDNGPGIQPAPKSHRCAPPPAYRALTAANSISQPITGGCLRAAVGFDPQGQPKTIHHYFAESPMKTGREAVDQDRRRFLETATAGMAAVGASSLLPSQPAAAPAGDGVRPLRFQASEEQLDDLRRRTAATKWPDKEQVPDTTQGVQLATMQALAQHWAK